MSHPTMGAWIEICVSKPLVITCFTSHPTMGAWIEMRIDKKKMPDIDVAPHDGCVD